MKVSEAFLVNTKNFDLIIETLVNHDAKEPVINSALLQDLGFSDPNDLLVVRILKDFKIIDNDGKPGLYFDEFKNPETTKIALAKGLITAYEGLFDTYPKIHQAPIEKIKEAFQGIFKGRKTELIIKYISGTFQKVVSFSGVSTIDKASKTMDEDPGLEPATVKTKSMTSNNNGYHGSADKENTIHTNQVSNKNIDELIGGFDGEDIKDETPTKEEKSDLTDKKITKDQNSTNNHTDSPVEEDPFGFEEVDSNSDPKNEKQKTQELDVDPIDLELPLSTATQNNNAMEQLTAEHQFVQKALLRKSDLLQKMNRWEDLLPTLEEIIERYDKKENIKLQEVVSRSIIRRAIALLKLNRTDEALPALNSVIDRFRNSDKKEFYDQASRAMLYKATILEKNSDNGLLPLYNTIINRLESESEILMKEKLDQIHLKRFDLITEEGENSEILDACAKLINRFKDNEEHIEYLQKAMIIRAEMLDEMGQDEEALAAYDQFLSTFGS